MISEAEVIVERRRLRRRLVFWRVAAVVILIAAVLGLVGSMGGLSGLEKQKNHIARIKIEGLITGDQPTLDLLKDIAEAKAVKGLVIRIDSPGGTTAGSEALFDAIRVVAKNKPVAAVMETVAASGGYITALAADHIVARETSLVGSIGVLFQYPETSQLLDKLGVRVEEVKSAPLKAEPSPFHPTSPEARAALQNVVNDTYDWFKRLVADRRKLDDAQVGTVSTGQVFSGRQGLPLKLVDQLGGERDAIAWLEREKNVRKDLPVRDWRPRDSSRFDLWTGAAVAADALGLETLALGLRQISLSSQSAKLDGLLALWQPALEK